MQYESCGACMGTGKSGARSPSWCTICSGTGRVYKRSPRVGGGGGGGVGGGGGNINPLVLLLGILGLGWFLMGPPSSSTSSTGHDRPAPTDTPGGPARDSRAPDLDTKGPSPTFPSGLTSNEPAIAEVPHAAAEPRLDENLRALLRGVGSLSVRVRTQGTAAAYLDATQFGREIEARLRARGRLGTDAAPGALTVDVLSMAGEREPGLEIFAIRVRFARRALLERPVARPVAVVSPWSGSVVGTVERMDAVGALQSAANDLVTRFMTLHEAANANDAAPVLADDSRLAIPTKQSLGGVPAVRLTVDVAPSAAPLISAEEVSRSVAAVLEIAGIPVRSTASATLAAQIQARQRGSELVWLVDLTVTDAASFVPMPDAPAEPVGGVAEIWRTSRLNYDTPATLHEAGGIVSELAREFARDYQAANATGLRETIIVR